MVTSILVELDSRVNGSDIGIVQENPMPPLTDEELLRRCAQGDEAGLKELVKRYQGPIFRFLHRMLGSAEDAEDAALDVFVRAWKNAPRFEFRSKVATWLYRIAVNVARDVHSYHKSRPQAPWPAAELAAHVSVGSAEDDAINSLETHRKVGVLQHAMERMNPNDRLLLVLYYYEEREYEEIQAITQLSYTVLKTRLTRARQRLRALVEAEDKGAMP